MRLSQGLSTRRRNNLQLIIFFVILTTLLTVTVILAWEKLLLGPFYGWVDERFPGVENAARRKLIQQRAEHFFISVTVDGIVVTLLLGIVRRQQRQLSESEERYRLLFEHANDGIGVVSTPDFRIIQCNRKFSETLGYQPHELPGKDVRELAERTETDGEADQRLSVLIGEALQEGGRDGAPPFDLTKLHQCPVRGMLTELYVRLANFVVSSTPESGESEINIQTPAGMIVPVSVSFSTLATGKEKLIIIILRDLSERRAAEEKMRQMQGRLAHNEKISALGRVAAQVAHEVKNPLAGLRLYSLHLKSKVAGKLADNEMDIVNKIADGIGRLSETTEQILNFARPINMALAPVDLNRAVTNTVQLLEPQSTANNVSVLVEAATPAPVGYLDEASIHAALMNLMLNAIQAMPDGGTLRVKTGREDNLLHLTIEDTGKGMNEEQLKNVFEPFYTTKSQGLGLGMPYAKKIIEQHQGTVRLESRVGHGTRIEIELPVEIFDAAADG